MAIANTATRDSARGWWPRAPPLRSLGRSQPGAKREGNTRSSRPPLSPRKAVEPSHNRADVRTPGVRASLFRRTEHPAGSGVVTVPILREAKSQLEPWQIRIGLPNFHRPPGERKGGFRFRESCGLAQNQAQSIPAKSGRRMAIPEGFSAEGQGLAHGPFGFIGQPDNHNDSNRSRVSTHRLST